MPPQARRPAGGVVIADHHLDMLAASGITPEHAAARGYETITDPRRLALIGIPKDGQRTMGVLVPQLRADGSPWGYQYRPDHPRERNGKVVKYETPTGQSNHIDVPPGVGPMLTDPTVPLWITEGVKKADCGALHGLCIVALPGVWNWLTKTPAGYPSGAQNAQGGKTAVADFNQIPLNNRTVIIAYDGDVARKPNVQQARRALASYLESKGAHVEYLHLPDTDNKTGLDDYLTDHTVDELRQLVKPASDTRTEKRSAAAQLVDIALVDYNLGVSDDGTPYGTQPGTPHVAQPLRGGKLGMRTKLAGRYFEKHKTVPSQQALADACNVIESHAAQQPPRTLHLRVAERDGAVYIDMADDRDRVIVIRDGAWTITDTAPVVFRRTELTAPMPEPVRGGQLDKLWDFVNVAGADRPILVAFMVATLIQALVAHVILGLLAEHGSAKSTTTRRIVSLLDPSVVPLRMPPRDIDQWITGANGSWVVALDNLSTIADWLSDALCRAATGDGNIKRQLYTDTGLSVIKILRCIIINGIDLGGLRGDLADRIALVDLDRITEDDRKPEAELEAEWEQHRPAILGGLLDLAAKVHHMLPTIKVERLPRMADFAKVLAAVDEINATEGLKRYRERAAHMAADSIASDPFIACLQELEYTFTDATAATILAKVTPKDDGWQRPQDWPKKARVVTTRLIRHAPALRSLGWHIANDNGQNKTHATLWTIKPPPDRTGQPEQPEQPQARYNGFSSSPKTMPLMS
jgi:hypothetical protein